MKYQRPSRTNSFKSGLDIKSDLIKENLETMTKSSNDPQYSHGSFLSTLYISDELLGIGGGKCLTGLFSTWVIDSSFLSDLTHSS